MGIQGRVAAGSAVHRGTERVRDGRMLVIMAIAQRAAAVARVVIVAWTVGAAEATGHAVVAGVDSAARKRIHDRAVVLRDKAADLQIANVSLPHRSARIGESDGALDRSDGARIGAEVIAGDRNPVETAAGWAA